MISHGERPSRFYWHQDPTGHKKARPVWGARLVEVGGVEPPSEGPYSGRLRA